MRADTYLPINEKNQPLLSLSDACCRVFAACNIFSNAQFLFMQY